MAQKNCFFALVCIGLVFLLVGGLVSSGSPSRESLSFVNYTDPIFPDGEVYLTQYWPRVGGQLGQNIFSGYPQYFKAY